MRRLIRERPWVIIALWILVVVVAGVYASKINEVVETSQEEFLPSHVESVRAENALKKITSKEAQGGGEPGFIILVHGVPVSLETYHDLKEWYLNDYKSMINGSSYTWIDAVASIEENITNGMKTAINNTLLAIDGIVKLSESYNHTLKALNGTAMLVSSVDSAYASLYNMSIGMQSSLDKLRSIQLAINTSCTITPLLVYNYYDVVRAEALLEELTNAYQTGALDNNSIRMVVEASNLSRQGIPPLDPGLVVLVYNTTLSIGGPENFSNIIAVNLAGRILADAINGSERLEPIIAGSISALAELVSNDIDHRSIIKGSENPAKGQIALLARLQDSMDEARTSAAYKTLASLLEPLPEESRGLAEIIGVKTIEDGCRDLNQSLASGISEYMSRAGIPPGMASNLAKAIVYGNLTSKLLLDAAIDLVRENMNESSSSIEDLLSAIRGIILELDPQGRGTLKGRESIGASSLLVAGTMGINLDEEARATLLNATDTHAAALQLLRLMLNNTNPQALGQLEALAGEDLLGAPREALLDRLPGILASSIASRAGMSISEAEAVVKAAIEVYRGTVDLDEASAMLANSTLSSLFQEIVGGMRGTLVEKELNGFIVSLEPEGANTSSRVENARRAKDLLGAGLESLGYKPELYMDGRSYMSYEIHESAQRDIERIDRLSMIFVILILALVLESLAAVFLPFIGIGFGIVISLAAAYVLAKSGYIDVTTQSRTIMFTTGLGLGIDYAAYVSKRFREAIAEGLDSRSAAAEAFAKSLRPVIAGAATASIGFGSMMLAKDFPFIASIGSNVPLTILAVMLASITFIPALLAYVGSRSWFWWPRHPVEARGRHRLEPLSRFITARPAIPLIIIALLTVSSILVAQGFEGSYDIALNLPRDAESRKALEVLNEYYDPGILYPLYIIPSTPQKAGEIAERLKSLECISTVTIKSSGNLIEARLAVPPLSSDGVKCADRARGIAHSIDPESLVGGASAINLDFRNLINDIFYKRVYPAAMTLMLITMLLAYGGLATAVSAILSVGLAAFWASAATIFIYNHVLGEDVIWFLPVIVFTAILGVGMDYNSFYLARAREECMKRCSREGVMLSMNLGSPIVLGLSIIMAGAYLGLAMTSSPGLSQMGLALVLGVLFAGVNAALALTPPLITLLGARAWWPSRRPAGAGDGG